MFVTKQIVLLTKIGLEAYERKFEHMSNLCCWCAAIISTWVGDSWDKLPCPPKNEGGDYTCEDLHDGRKSIKRT